MFGWLIEHLLLKLPTEFWIALALTGAVAYYLSDLITALPLFKSYGILIKFIGMVALLGGVFMTGGEGVSTIWQQKVKELSAKVAAAEAKSAVTNTIIETKVVEKIKVVKSVQVVLKDRIVEKEKIIDKDCKVSPEVIDILNQAAKTPGGAK